MSFTILDNDVIDLSSDEASSVIDISTGIKEADDRENNIDYVMNSDEEKGFCVPWRGSTQSPHTKITYYRSNVYKGARWSIILPAEIWRLIFDLLLADFLYFGLSSEGRESRHALSVACQVCTVWRAQSRKLFCGYTSGVCIKKMITSITGREEYNPQVKYTFSNDKSLTRFIDCLSE
jgi:hypothetical protein